MWANCYDARGYHITDRVNFALIARVQLNKLREWGHKRGWRRLRLLCSTNNTFNQDLGVENARDQQPPAMSVFTSNEKGAIDLFYTTEGSLVERHHRSMDLFTPVWNLFDLLPEGRGDWFPKHFYAE